MINSSIDRASAENALEKHICCYNRVEKNDAFLCSLPTHKSSMQMRRRWWWADPSSPSAARRLPGGWAASECGSERGRPELPAGWCCSCTETECQSSSGKGKSTRYPKKRKEKRLKSVERKRVVIFTSGFRASWWWFRWQSSQSLPGILQFLRSCAGWKRNPKCTARSKRAAAQSEEPNSSQWFQHFQRSSKIRI